MAEREKYYIGLNGQIFEVNKELYDTYYKGQREYYVAAEPPVRCGVSHLSGLTEPLI